MKYIQKVMFTAQPSMLLMQLQKDIRIDLVDTDIRVTTIDPGIAETEFSIVSFRGNVNKAKDVYKGIEH